MASETITRNDLTAILNSVLPNPADMTPQEVEDFIDSIGGGRVDPIRINYASGVTVPISTDVSILFFITDVGLYLAPA